ncbi:EF-hand calcium-binding domain-containing protein 11 isoform X2 [Dama dama]|uniref:EF-hand calcium-binding domain-containing protein 11 isoform X2 n=1 Tax=Dama dama TaxID=30532 RepID=UPI002A36C096|nr:EF-hand calcium-binding domain-containing protein 11 isoform X2 [Dama dama]
MFYSQAGARPRTWETSPPEHKKWVEVFKACDEDNKGYLSREDFKVAVVMLFGYKPSKIEADSVMSSVDPNTSGIQLKEFLDIIRKKKEAQVYCNEVRHIFTAFDRHYRGYLTLEDFKKAFKQVAPKLSERIILEVFRFLVPHSWFQMGVFSASGQHVKALIRGETETEEEPCSCCPVYRIFTVFAGERVFNRYMSE